VSQYFFVGTNSLQVSRSISDLGTLLAKAEDLQIVSDFGELVPLRRELCHLLDLGDLDLSRHATLSTDDVVMMALIDATMTKEFLSLRRDDRVEVTLIDQDLQLTIDRSETERFTARFELLMDLLRTQESIDALEMFEYQVASRGIAALLGTSRTSRHPANLSNSTTTSP
jgi:hypothetical protein